MLQTLVSKKYKLSEKLAIGPFYQVFKGVHHHNQIGVAVKIEKRSVSQSKIFNEAKILKEIQGEDQTADLGFPHILESYHEGNYNCLVMELFGPSLDKLMLQRRGSLEAKFTLEIGVQVVERIQTLHQKGYVHRDVRPQHFLYGRPKRPNKLYLTGLSMARKYVLLDKRHTIYKDNKASFTGTARYLSITGHMGIQQSRRDDIESMVYTLIFLLKGSLPWQNLKGIDKKDKFDKILLAKVVTPIEVICESTPPIMPQLLRYARMLQYQDCPDYQYLKTSLRKAGEALQEDLIFHG